MGRIPGLCVNSEGMKPCCNPFHSPYQAAAANPRRKIDRKAIEGLPQSPLSVGLIGGGQLW